MPKYNFLEKGKKLNKDNFTSHIFALFNESIKTGNDKNEGIFKEKDKHDADIADLTLRYFVDESKKYIVETAHEFIQEIGFTKKVRDRAIQEWLEVLNEYAFPSPELTKLKELFKSNQKNSAYSINQLSEKVKQLIDPKYYKYVKSNEIDFVNYADIVDHLDKYMDFLSEKMNDEEIGAIGNSVNDYYSQYIFDSFDLTKNPIYQKETDELINELNTNKTLDNKVLNQEEINEYVNSLNYANKLFTKPGVNFDYVFKEKLAISRGVSKELDNNIDERIKKLGFETGVIRSANYKTGVGFYLTLGYGKEDAYKKNVSDTEMKFSNEAKEGLKIILKKIHEYGFDKINLKDDVNNSAIGLGYIEELGKKYKEAISSPNLEDRKKAIIYAKELESVDVKTKEILGLIEKYLPVEDLNNLAFSSSTDVLKNENIPIDLRVNYAKTAQLAGLCNIASLIEHKKWDIDEFIDSPLKHMKESYKEDYLDKIDPLLQTKGLKSTDLMFNIATKKIDDLADLLSFNGIQIVSNLPNLDKNKDNRLYNQAMYDIFNNNIDQPIYTVYESRGMISNDKYLDRIIINPNLEFKDLGITYYDINNLKIHNEDEIGFNEIEYIKDKKESFKEFKDRLDTSILDFMQKELNLVKMQNDPNALFFKTNDYIDIATTAAIKMLVVRRNEKDDISYKELENLIKNKKAYVDTLIDKINNDPKYDKYQDVKEAYNNPISVNNNPYSLNISNNNKYKNILTNYDNYINQTKEGFRRKEQIFISEEVTKNENLKNAYNTYIDLENKYIREVNKIHGSNYQGIPDNTRNDRIKDAFIKRNEAYNKLSSAKRNYLYSLEAPVKYGRVPFSYYLSRLDQLKKNNYKELPPYFDMPLSKKDYINSKFSGAILTEEQKDYLFAEYSNYIKQKENDFFSKKFLETNKLATKTDTIVDLGRVENKKVEFNLQLEEAKFYAISNNMVNELGIGNEKSNFDEVDYLYKNSVSPYNFKANLDKLLIENLSLYKSVNGNQNDLAERPSLESIIDVAQRATLKYMLVSNYNNTDSLSKDLENFIIDGRGYLNKILNEEKNKINSGNSELNDASKNIISSLNLNELNINDFNINQYSNKFNEFNTYYEETKNSGIPDDLKRYEKRVNTQIKNKLWEIEKIRKDPNKFLINEQKKAEKDEDELDEDADDVSDTLEFLANYNKYVKPAPIKDEEEPIDDPEYKVATLKLDIIKIKDDYKKRLDEYYKNGQVTDYYVNEKYKRLDNNIFKSPSLYRISNIPALDVYINQKYPDMANELSDNEKNDLYNNYKNQLEVERRNNILNNFLVVKELTEEKELISKDYTDYLAKRPTDLLLELDNKQLIKPEKLHKDDEVYVENKNQEFVDRINQFEKTKAKKNFNIEDDIIINNKKDEIDIDSDNSIDIDNRIIINKKDEKDALEFDSNEEILFKSDDDEIDKKEIVDDLYYFEGEKRVEYTVSHAAESMWVKSLIKVIAEKTGRITYQGKSLDELFKYDPKSDLFEYWVEDHANILREIFGKDLPTAFNESVNRLPHNWKIEFEKAYYQNNNSLEKNDYYNNLFGEYKFTFKDEDLKNNNESNEKEDIEEVPEKYLDFSKQIERDINDGEVKLTIDDYNVGEEIENIIDTRTKK